MKYAKYASDSAKGKLGRIYNLMKCYTDTSTAAVPYYP